MEEQISKSCQLSHDLWEQVQAKSEWNQKKDLRQETYFEEFIQRYLEGRGEENSVYSKCFYHKYVVDVEHENKRYDEQGNERYEVDSGFCGRVFILKNKGWIEHKEAKMLKGSVLLSNSYVAE